MAKGKKTPPPKPTPSDELDEQGLPFFISTDTLAFVTGVSGRRLHQLISDSRIPIDVKEGCPEGYWHTSKALVEIFGYYRRQADKSKPTADLEMERELLREDLRTKKIKNAKATRELLPHQIVAQVWGELLSILKGRFIIFPSKMGPRAFNAKDKVEAAELLEAEIRDILAGLPEQIEDLAGKIRDDEFSENAEPSPTAAGPAQPADLVPEDA